MGTRVVPLAAPTLQILQSCANASDGVLMELTWTIQTMGLRREAKQALASKPRVCHTQSVENALGLVGGAKRDQMSPGPPGWPAANALPSCAWSCKQEPSRQGEGSLRGRENPPRAGCRHPSTQGSDSGQPTFFSKPDNSNIILSVSKYNSGLHGNCRHSLLSGARAHWLHSVRQQQEHMLLPGKHAGPKGSTCGSWSRGKPTLTCMGEA